MCYTVVQSHKKNSAIVYFLFYVDTQQFGIERHKICRPGAMAFPLNVKRGSVDTPNARVALRDVHVERVVR